MYNLKIFLFLSLFIISSVHAKHIEKIPSQVLVLKNWKLTLPYAKKGNKAPLEVLQPLLNKYQDPKCFYVNKKGDGVVFRAWCSGASTKGSKFPRCELREMDGLKKIGTKLKDVNTKWNTSGNMLHQLTVTQAITAIPPVTKQVVSAQIHNKEAYVIMIRLDDRKLYIEVNKFGDIILDSNYKLGTKFSIKIKAKNNKIEVYYNNELKMDWKTSREGCYFKAGCYTQSNTEKGDKPESYGEVVIYNLKVENINKSK